MAANTTRTSVDGETVRPAFPGHDEVVSYGLPFATACKKHIDSSLGVEHAYIIASDGLASSSDKVVKLEAALGDKHVGTWNGIPAHTPYDGLIPILHDVKAKHADCLITLGGGSVMDAAKLLVYAIENGVDSVDDLIELEKPFIHLDEKALKGIGNAPKMSLIFMPTTLSGAEYSNFAGCTNPVNHMKVQFTHPFMWAKLIILDPDLCRTTPDWVWRSTGVRAIDHCVENICSSKPKPEVDEACERGLRDMVPALLAYARDPNDLQARLAAQISTNYSMTAITLFVLCGASHGIGHNLGPLGVGHGQTSCILLPAVMKYNARVNKPQQDHIKHILWSEHEVAGILQKHGLQQDSSDAGDALRAIFDELGMPRCLEDVAVGRDKWDQLAENSLADIYCKANPIPLTDPKQVIEILEMCSSA